MKHSDEHIIHDVSSLLMGGTRGARLNILIAPLNWGLGHASRCIPLIRQALADGHRVTLGGDGDSLLLLRKHFPELPVVRLASLELHYSKGNSQVATLLRQLPTILRWIIQDHKMLYQVLSYQHFDQVISDNRFGLYGRRTPNAEHRTSKHIYITHQLMIKMPRGWKWAEGIAHWLHCRMIHRYHECWVPDFADQKHNLSGDLSHKYPLPKNARFIGLLSRFSPASSIEHRASNIEHQAYAVALLSGLEPQRSLFEKQIMEEYSQKEASLLIVRGKLNEPFCKIQHGNITLVPHLPDKELAQALLQADTIIARSGYSTIMDLHVLGVLHKAHLTATPGQTEQEYLEQWNANK